MDEARHYLEEIIGLDYQWKNDEELFGYAEDYGCIYNLIVAGGFVFRDGSVLEIGEGNDHRVIDIDRWGKEKMITYRIFGQELIVRIHGEISYAQRKTLQECIDLYGITEIVYSFYDENDKLVSEGVVYDLYELLEEVMEVIK